MHALSMLMFSKPRQVSALVVVLLCVGTGLAQSAATMKQGLWEMTVTSSTTMTMPPDVEAKIAQMPADQQAMMRSRMGGAPQKMTNKACVGPQESMDSMLDRVQNRPGFKCSFTNRVHTGNTASFDMACTMAQGTMSGHTEFRKIDDDHMTGTAHMAGKMTTTRGSSAMKTDSTTVYKYLGADCGDVKPYSPPPASGK